MFLNAKKQKPSNLPSSAEKTPTPIPGPHHRSTRRQPPLATAPSPLLFRSRSRTEDNSSNINNQRITSRSKSTSRSTTIKGESPSYNGYNWSSSTTQKRSSDQESNCSSDGGTRAGIMSPGGGNRGVLTKARPPTGSSSPSPSAWALSPGRSTTLMGSPMLPEWPRDAPTESGKAKRSGGVGGVLKYFRQKKVCPLQEEGFHRFRVLYNRLLQWRFANAKAEASMVAAKMVAQDRIFHVWLRMINVRSSILEKRLEVGRYENDIKLRRIVYPQMRLLHGWEKIESRNCEAVSRMARKLSAVSVKLPLVEDAEGDVESIREAMNMAMQVMEDIETTVTMFFSQMEKVLFLVTELASAAEDQNESLEEMESLMALVVMLVELEEGARVELINCMDISLPTLN